ncbi:MAG TPA: exodeoxyribonuclease VII large subunit [Burkholderiales bacterium]|nr:exodeoxyribonuclease VII large subunit [Burkholderiales bacterium]
MDLLSVADKSSRVIGVAELNRLAKDLIERQLPLMWVAGEISNFMRAASGHCYFSLKDAQAQVRCVMFRHKAQLHDWKPENGMQIEVRATPSFYEARGEFQLNVEAMRRAGLGALYAAFEQLKARLSAEGLFAEERKQVLPRFPRAIGIVTSPHAAALRDVLTTLKRRMPAIPIIIYPTPVQGEGAAAKIAAALATADARAECDVLILCRGGGSIEDLWAFNEEVVARAIDACNLPVICGVGHETDFTIADFVADVRAPTPTAAAQLACPNCVDLRERAVQLYHRFKRVMERALERRMQHVDGLARRLVHPGERIANQLRDVAQLRGRLRSAWARAGADRQWQLRDLVQRLRAGGPDVGALVIRQDVLAHRLGGAAIKRVETLTARLKSMAAHLAHLNPQSVFERGYSMVETADGKVVRASSEVQLNEDVKLTFSRGWARANVKDKG